MGVGYGSPGLSSDALTYTRSTQSGHFASLFDMQKAHIIGRIRSKCVVQLSMFTGLGMQHVQVPHKANLRK